MIHFHDPRAEPGVEPRPYDLTFDAEPETTVGLLANGFPDSERFLDCVAEVLEEQRPGLRIKRYNKHNASVLASDQILDGITAECKAVVTAYGH